MNTNSPRNTDDQEINLGMISDKIGNFFENINYFIFRMIKFIIKHIVVLAILFVLGVGIGLMLDKSHKSYDHQIVVKPNFNSADYLYSKVDLIESKIKEKDTAFLAAIGIQNPSKITKIEIKPIVDIYQFVNNNSEQNFQLLKLMAEDSDIKKTLEESTTSKNYPFHLISFTTKDFTTRQKTVEPIMKFLNNSAFYAKVQKEYVNNIHLKMKANDLLISQIDAFLNGLSSQGSKDGKLVYYSENTQLNDVIETKDRIVKEQGNHRIDLVSLDAIVKERTVITNIENNASVNGKLKLVLPLLFILLYVGIHFFIRFYKTQSVKHQQ